MNNVTERVPADTLNERIRRVLDTQPQVEKALVNYARDLGVSVDHVIMGALLVVAADYNRATGDGMIPRLTAEHAA